MLSASASILDTEEILPPLERALAIFEPWYDCSQERVFRSLLGDVAKDYASSHSKARDRTNIAKIRKQLDSLAAMAENLTRVLQKADRHRIDELASFISEQSFVFRHPGQRNQIIRGAVGIQSGGVFVCLLSPHDVRTSVSDPAAPPLLMERASALAVASKAAASRLPTGKGANASAALARVGHPKPRMVRALIELGPVSA